MGPERRTWGGLGTEALGPRLPAHAGAVDNVNSIIPIISKSRRPMDSIPSLGTAPVDATVRQYYGLERPGCVKTGRL